ncbi:hypothetical protein, partial [Stenotrophomonas maltophilia]|uniref:hypothetical protein n=1 Tax=Stenotrophomonas maltophilia TaxID=40324 RepID=UPI00195464C4
MSPEAAPREPAPRRVASAEAPEVDDGKAFAADLAEDLAGVAPLAPSADTGEEAPAESINS